MPAATSSDERRLLPEPVRRPAAVLACCCAVVFATLAVKYRGGDDYGNVDRWVVAHLSARGSWQRALTLAVQVAPWIFLAVAAVAAITALLARMWRYAALTVLSPALALLVAELGKPVIGRTIDGGLALPSGHTAGVTSVSLAAAVLLLDRFRAHAVRAAVLGLAVVTVLSCAMAVVMVSLQFHYATDTAAGYCVATATTLGAAFALDWLSGRWRARRSKGVPSRSGRTFTVAAHERG